MSSIDPVKAISAKPEAVVPAKPAKPSSVTNKGTDSTSISPQAKQLLANDKDHDGDTDGAGGKEHGGNKPASSAPKAVTKPSPSSSASADALTTSVNALRKNGMSVADIAQRLNKSEAQIRAIVNAAQHA